jgi:hypothetical protein
MSFNISFHDKFSKDYPLGTHFHVDVCKSQLIPEDLEGKLKHDFASCVSRTSLSHRTYYVHLEDWKVFNEISTGDLNETSAQRRMALHPVS